MVTAFLAVKEKLLQAGAQDYKKKQLKKQFLKDKNNILAAIGCVFLVSLCIMSQKNSIVDTHQKP